MMAYSIQSQVPSFSGCQNGQNHSSVHGPSVQSEHHAMSHRQDDKTFSTCIDPVPPGH